MYYHAQPSLNFMEVVQNNTQSDDIFYDKHYLSKEFFECIMNKYIDAYGLSSKFKDHCELIENFFDNPVEKDYSNGYKSYKDVEPLKDKIGEENWNIVKEYFEKTQNFYTRDMDKEKFSFNICNFGPTSNKQTVIDYWKSQGKTIEIKDYNDDEIFDLTYYGEILSDEI